MEYFLAQYVRDPFRQEAVNVGLFLAHDGGVACKFIDGPEVSRLVKHPDVFRQWVEYWREEVQNGVKGIVNKDGGGNYRVVEGGSVFHNPKSVAENLDELFDWLVATPDEVAA